MLNLKSNQVIKFLEDFESNSTVELLEGASKEKNELIASAKKRGILAEGSRDLGLIKTIYLFTDQFNDNGDMISSAELQKKFPQIVGKPMNVNHERTLIVGVYIDYKFILKEKKAITYATFFKSIYPKLWEKVKAFKNRGKLSSSFEIWSPENKRKIFPNGTEELRQIEIAGGALIFEEKGVTPAFRDAKVLAIAKSQLAKQLTESCMVYASKYKDKEIIVANQNHFKNEVEENYQKMLEEQNKLPVIKCSNCEKDFESAEQTNIKCPSCFAIVNKAGVMIYPPQIKNFKMLCPACKIDNWLIVSNTEEAAKIKCQSCTKDYLIKFSKEEKSELLDKMTFLFIGHATCPQCSNSVSVEGSSKMEATPLTCPSCKLKFIFNRAKMEQYKQISEIDEIVEKPKEEPNKDKESSKEGGEEEMVIPKEIEKIVKEEDTKTEKLKEKPSPQEKVKTKSEKTEEVVEDKKPEKSQAEPKKAQKETVEKVEEPKAEKPSKEPKEKTTEKVKITKEAKDETSTEEPVAKETKTAKEETIEDKTTTEEPKETAIPVIDEKIIKDIEEASSETPVAIEESKIPVEEIKIVKSTKILRKAVTKIKELKKELNEIKEKKETLISAVKKTTSQVISLKEEITKIKENSEKKISLYKENAQLIVSRKDELGEEYSKELSDEDILNEDKFERAKLEKENDMLRGSKDNDTLVVGEKPNAKDEEIDKQAKEIDDKAYGRKKRNA